MKKRELKPRFRVMYGEDIALGPGKIELLQLLDKTESLRKAAMLMDMSYMRAWSLVRMMNDCFSADVVTLTRGGRKGGSAQLTALGRKILVLYVEMETISLKASGSTWLRLKDCLRK